MSNRSNSKNPNNPAHKAGQDNRANQLNPDHLPSKGGDSGTNSSAGQPQMSDPFYVIPHHLGDDDGDKKIEPKKEEVVVPYRLGKVALEFNVSIGTIVDFLMSKGHAVEFNPNTKISEDWNNLLLAEFKK